MRYYFVLISVCFF